MTPYQDHVSKWKNCTKCRLCETRNRTVFCRGKLPCDVLFVGEAPGDSENVLGEPFIGPAGRLLDKILADAVSSDTRVCLTNLLCCIPMVLDPVVVNINYEEFDVRIDRESQWGNPFKIGVDGNRSEVIVKFSQWLREQPTLLRKLETLSGLRLGCHCKPKKCHGDEIVRLFRETVSRGKLREPPEWAIQACSTRLEEFIEIAKPKLIIAVGGSAKKALRDRTKVSITHPSAILRADVTQIGLLVQQAVVTIADAVADLK